MEDKDFIEKIEEMVKHTKHGLFAEKETPAEGYEYAERVISSFPKELRIYAYTALHVYVNSLMAQLQRYLIEVQHD